MSEQVYGYFLHVNGQRVQEIFEEFEDAMEAARPHMDITKMAALKIQSTSDVPAKTWNYDFVQFFRGLFKVFNVLYMVLLMFGEGTVTKLE